MEGADVPDLGVADDLEAGRVEHTAQVLVQLVKLVDLLLHPRVNEIGIGT